MTKAYLDIVASILENGTRMPNRTGIDAISSFGHQMKFNLRNNTLPMITTKFISFKTIATELFWFLRGDTNQRHLEEQNVKIWKANCSRKALNDRKLFNYTEYETLGPIYGFQWRHFGAKYIDAKTNYSGQGVDQLYNAYKEICENPTSRRIMMSAWNPCDLEKMVLPPCHSFIQFHVDTEKRELSGQMYQRSGDMMLGVPYNITSYALLLHIMARACNLTAGDLIHILGNAHIYESHIDAAKEQVTRVPYEHPKIEMNFDTNVDFNTMIENLHISQFKVLDYKHHDKIYYEMVV
ncbi:thymidylate synthase/pyrimidine hydroxymethylase-like protein [Drosophila innubila nudivirus]|uniref:thymidylate synthase n=1 Tax=Drosophila innubila nudivirus TaxID=2057187 RepID=A0A2H4UX96_9VIRU|nr:thymidylate synthase/pyrimidine hydroxymethylase-like protein [Drosophila innubila nudivirus]ATZ81542.1 thymidylate synthase/pyrimidine hydroxymethylase-like protein [Drosophila innubila nudivirus]